MMKDNTNAPTDATLTASELFQRFLDAPVRDDSISNLKTGRLIPLEGTVQENYFAYFGLKDMARNLTVLLRQFSMLSESLRIEAPDEDAPAKEHRDWENNPTYMIPTTAGGMEDAA
jgi:hypothetical protein